MSLRDGLASVTRRAVADLIQRGWRWVQVAGAIRADTAAGHRFARFGPGSSVAFPTATIFGEPWIRVGTDTLIGQHITLSAGLVPGLDLGPEPVVTIGDRCTIGRGSHIVGHQRVEIADDVFTGPYVYITDQNHGYEDPDTPIGRQWPKNDAVRIGPGCWLGAGALVLPGTTIGRNVVVAGGAVVRGEFDDRCVLAGVPARVVRRYVPGEGWRRAPDATPDTDAEARAALLARDADLDATSTPPA